MATWELIKDGTVVSSNDTGIFKISDPVGTQYTIRNTVLGQEIPYTRAQECCDCNSLSFTQTLEEFDVKGTNGEFVTIGTISNFGNCNIVPTPLNTGFQMRLSGNNVQCRVDRAESPRILNFQLKPCTTGGKLYQRCYRGTDNGNTTYIDEHGNIKLEEHPVLLCYAYHGGEAGDNDSIRVSDCKILKPNGNPDVDSDWETFDRNFGPNGQGYYYGTGNWLHVFWEEDRPGIGCGYGMVTYTAQKNLTGNEREVTIHFRTSPDNTICDSVDPSFHPGSPACEYWDVPVRQAPQGKKWCKFCEAELRKTLLIDMDDSCDNHLDQCTQCGCSRATCDPDCHNTE